MTTKYRNKGGQHVTTNEVVVPTGGVFESEDRDLMTKFPNKFERVYTEDVPAQAPPPAQAPAPVDADYDDEAEFDDNPVDVTSDFPLAVKNGLRVTRDSKSNYTINDGAEVVTEAPVAKKEVNKIIKEYLAD